MVRWLGKIGAADWVTLANGFLGALAITYVLDGEHVIASLLILLAVIMDGLDGMVARRFQSPHEFGRFLDSLSDAVSFCLAPGLIIYNNFYDRTLGTSWNSFPNAIATVGAMLFVVFGLLRLARFAGKDFNRRGFLGLPTPAAAMVAIVLCLLWGNMDLSPFSITYELYLVTGAIIVLAILMISDIPYPKIQGKTALVIGAAMLPGIVPILTYLASPSYDLPYSEILIMFLGLLMVYVLGGPVYEKNRKSKARQRKLKAKT